MYEIGPQLATSGATGRRAERAGSRLQRWSQALSTAAAIAITVSTGRK
ncbi:hypothetical protein PPTG_23940 [Phytophthora nicotianae INRA-310]|uniref:Uncharacterized protein n=1 Tax=Phytophthora nicotianae (strain INRA-310) TaxID=761204 RepID=W2PQ13_PHYN3|nr:hypothetical protein PPTG_23940 [Phytophthora nicotianae INRA-310]ETN02324.1 hypothetical protein PPTG_23940 [Phytophthora nicotianae INRA-310]